jgi:hypothetical protein
MMPAKKVALPIKTNYTISNLLCCNYQVIFCSSSKQLYTYGKKVASKKIKYPVHISKNKQKTSYPFPAKSKRKEEVPSFSNALARFTIVSFPLR